MRFSNYKTAGLFLLLIAVLVCGTWISYRATMRIAESERQVAHTYEVIGAIDSLISVLQRSQNTASDFIATGKADYRTIYQSASARIGPGTDAIRVLTSDNPQQQEAIAAIAAKATQFKAKMDKAVEARALGATEAITGDEQRDIVRDLRAMKTRETSLLTSRSAGAALSLMTTRLGLLIGALVNCVLLGLGAYVVMRDQRQRSMIRESRLRLASIVDSSDDAIISKTLDGTITSWNHGAERQYGYTAGEMVGKSIYGIVPADRHDELRIILEKLGRGERIEHLETRRLRRDGAQIEVELMVSPVTNERGVVTGASAIGRDITERKRLERSLHQLSIRILKAQDEERRRIAREIHDTTVQKLALLSMNLAQLKNAAANPEKTLATLENSQGLTSECVQELRTLSYLLHPPMLDELGLASALRIYVEGIAKRSGIAITAEVDPEVPRLDPDAEMALFRVAQESLSNVLRHSGSRTAKIRLAKSDGIEMKIIDEGKGMAAREMETDVPIIVGVGIPGMNERITQLGGVLTIDSGPNGTTVTARVPAGKAANA